MPQGLLFVNKSHTSEQLSQSAQAEARAIRTHVQTGRPHKRRQPPAQKLKRAQDSNPQHAAPPPHPTPSGGTQAHTIVFRSRPNARRAKGSSKNAKPASLITAAPGQTRPATATPREASGRLSRILDASYTIPKELALADLGLCDEEHISLAFFVGRTATQWAGWQDAHFWRSLVLQACQHSKAVAHALISFAALDKSCEKGIDRQYESRLQALAVRQTRKAMGLVNTTSPSLLVSLVSCVIFICLHNYQDTQKAQRLLQSGATALHNLEDPSSPARLAATADDLYMIERYVRPLFDRLQSRYCIIADAPVALVRSVLQFRASGASPAPMPTVPATFASLTDARDCLDGILRWGHDTVPMPHAPASAMNKFRVTLKQLLRTWLAASDESTVSPDSTQPQGQSHSGRLLRAARLYGSIILNTFGTPVETAFDAYLPEFEELVQILQDISLEDDPQGRSSFGIDAGLLDMISLTAQRCRDPKTRRGAIDFVLKVDRVEGDRVGQIGVNILRTIIDAEEDGLEPRCAADIPESHRFRVFEDRQYFGLSKLCILLVAHPYDVTKGARVVEKWASIPNDAFIQRTKIAPAEAKCIDVPSMVYGANKAAFLEDASSRTYYEFAFPRFYFPIPRV